MRIVAASLLLFALSHQLCARVFSSINLAGSFAEAGLVVEAVVTSANQVGDLVRYELAVSRAISGSTPDTVMFCSTEMISVGMHVLFAASTDQFRKECVPSHSRYTSHYFVIPLVRDATTEGTVRMALLPDEHQFLGCTSDDTVAIPPSRGAARHNWPPDWDRTFLFPLAAFKECAGLPADES